MLGQPSPSIGLAEQAVGWVTSKLVESWGNRRRLSWENWLGWGYMLGKVGSIVGVWVERRCGSHLLPEVAVEAALFYS
jgi:hypothetical protein